MKSETMTLPVTLTLEEKLVRAGELASRLAELDEVQERKRDANAQCKAEAEKLEAKISELARIVRSGKEPREVEVQEVRNETARTMETIRCDTNELVSSRAMLIGELQRPLFDEHLEISVPKPLRAV